MNCTSTIRKIREKVEGFGSLSDVEIREQSLSLRHEAMSGAPVKDILVPGFALVVEAARRCLNQVHYDVQLLCGLQMVAGKIAEMKTGEGKTLTASLAGYLLGLRGRGLHLVTFNDYLAERDCAQLRPVYQMLGLTVDVLNPDVPPERRKQAYQCDITYGSAKEFGFDFLRDRLKIAETGDVNAGVMRGTVFALVDEADSILIDEAKTPLIIGMVNRSEEKISQSCFLWAAEHADQFVESQHYEYDSLRQSVKLNSEGIRLVRSFPQNTETQQVSVLQLYDYMQNAIKVRRDFKLDKNYAIRDGEIIIIDEFTGRPAEGRQWQNGIHQSVQAKEGVEITPATRQAASITIQSFFKRYKMFCGMTGTAWTSRKELKTVFKKKVVQIPTHRPIQRKAYPNRVFGNMEDKFSAVAKSTLEMLSKGRAVLIGTRSVGKSELLADVLEKHDVGFQILNAKNLEREAEIVAAAGLDARVTLATNMAGRGTDIKLSDAVREAGGLHVILTELHESQRIDWQLIGRGSRQGDPGSYQVFVSMDDEILQIGFGPTRAEQLFRKYRNASRRKLDSAFSYFRVAQKKAERRYLTDRLVVLKQDLEKQKSLFETGQDPFLSSVGY